MARALSYFLAIVIGAAVLPFISPSSVPFLLITGAMIAITIPLLDAVASNIRYLRLGWYSIRYWNRSIRLSVSYLFRIKVDGSYLLVRSHRRPTYGPVGGVYKVSPGAKAVLDEVHALDDDLIPMDEVSRHDLRIHIRGGRLITFVKWFESGHSRETSPWREFSEELIKPGILPAAQFPYIFHDFIRRDIRPLAYSKQAQSMELKIADIHELLPTPEQYAVLQKLKQVGNPEILWATQDHIRRLGAIPGTPQDITIGESATWIL
jgi:hypothetical protein